MKESNSNNPIKENEIEFDMYIAKIDGNSINGFQKPELNCVIQKTNIFF